MQTEHYFGRYVAFKTVSKKDASVLLGADTTVGDVLEIVFKTNKNTNVAWLKNRFGTLVGYFEPDISRKLNIMKISGWNLEAVLSFVAFTDTPQPGHYWGQVALICYDSSLNQIITPFIKTISERLVEDIRPDINLGQEGVHNLIESNGTWQPHQTVPLPKKEAGTVIIKSHRTISEKIIEKGRSRNKGCYFLSWIFLLGLITVLIFTLKACGLF